MFLLVLLIAVMAQAEPPMKSWLHIENENVSKIAQLNWTGICETGKMQSPIELYELKSISANPEKPLALINASLEQTDMSIYYNGYIVILHNFTHSLQLRGVMDAGDKPYIAEQIHFHCGVEHVIEGTRYDMEMQIIHRNANFSSLDEAMDKRFGLAVISVLFKVTSKPNRAIAAMMSTMQRGRETGEKKLIMDEGIIIEELYGQINSYYQYEGSLTVPGCQESVLWMVLTQVQTMTSEQLAAFCNIEDGLYSARRHTNVRNLQDANERFVFFIKGNGMQPKVKKNMEMIIYLVLVFDFA